MISASFQGQGEIFKMPFSWIPSNPSLDNYQYSIDVGGLAKAMKVSIIASALMIGIQVSLSTITGYVFCKYKFRFKNIILIFVLMTVMIPIEITFLPLFDLIRTLKLTNTYIGLVLPFLYSGFGIIYIMQFSKYIPDSILEAARIDGCGNIKTFIYVALPMLKSAISGLIILAFTFIWSEFAWARIIITKDSLRPLSIVVTHLSKGVDNYVNYAGLVAAGVMMMGPILVVFMLFQKNFIKSVMSSGVKG
jgi:ABC-type glycerol-3-phosphate transport system permease component